MPEPDPGRVTDPAALPGHVTAEVLIFSSDPRLACVDWMERFERYITQSSASSISLAVTSQAQVRECIQRFIGGADRFALILWDAAAGAPPKEIEALLSRLNQAPLVFGARYKSGSVARAVSARRQLGGSILGSIRNAAGLSSDPRPPFAGLHRDAFGADFINHLQEPVRDWPASMWREARRRRIPAIEIPVMWGCSAQTLLDGQDNMTMSMGIKAQTTRETTHN